MFDRKRLESFIKDPRTLRDFEYLLFLVEQQLPSDIAEQGSSEASQLLIGIADAKDAATEAESIAQAALSLAQSIAESSAADEASMLASMALAKSNITGFTGTFQTAALNTVHVENGIIVRIV
jgi:hypothetical protein